MLKKFIASKFCDREGRGLVKLIPALRHRFHLHYGINLPTVPYAGAFTTEQRSAAEQALEQLKAAAQANYDSNNPIPHTIWLYWNTPLEQAPHVVQQSLKTWRYLNPNHKVVFLTDQNLNDTLGFDFNAVFKLATVNLGYAMKADILRLYLLSQYGGIWADTTTFCLNPLDKWLAQETQQTGIFTFRHEQNQTRPVEAWFIAAQQGHPVITQTLALFLEHLFKPRKMALKVSNRIKTIGRSDTENTRFFADVVYHAERKGFMPYFSVGYFFNQAFQRQPGLWETFTQMNNQHANHGTPLEMTRHALVSKQTYKKDYQQSDMYRERVALSDTLIEGQTPNEEGSDPINVT
ncbi:hypothetical protein FJM67_04840 [Maribrevibacterium harenarium]|uniref:Capsular polysaccharide synthesis protein n=1 Tax=Maribrevibacterium harenarium TaxID=2589817 RepID=A0A501WXR3_9GAMM|nr:capsular polysaccharide synthesis protein [Maribrevibacterium harenarium]TPE54278.1 hypothetical protein FJM67_04840 [Maribrevibacterium harenarium]